MGVPGVSRPGDGRRRARRRGAGGQVPRPEPDPGAQRDPGTGRLAAARGTGGAGAGHAPAAVRDRGAGLVLPALPHRAAASGGAARLPRPVVLAAGRGRADRRDPERATARTPTSRSSRCPASAGATSRPPSRQRAPGARPATPTTWSPPPGTAPCRGRGGRAVRGRGRPWPNDPYGPGEERYRVLRAVLAGELQRRLGRRRPCRTPGCAAWAARASRPGGSGSWSRRRRPARSTPSATPTSPSPGPSRTGRSWPSSRTWCSRGCCSGMLVGRAPRRAGCSSGTSTAPRRRCIRERDRGAARRRAGRRGRARPRAAAVGRGVHVSPGGYILGRGVGADRVHGGAPRRAAQQAAVPRHLRPVGQAHADELGGDVRGRAGHREPRRRRGGGARASAAPPA